MAWPTPRDAEVPTRTDVERAVTGALRHALAYLWWSVRAHMADVHLLPRGDALEPPLAPWLERPETTPAAKAMDVTPARPRERSQPP